MSRSALLKRAQSPVVRMEQYGNTATYNLETVLRENIVRSQYWEKTCVELEGWQEVVDEIYYSVEHCEPWMSGNARGPSTAFCLMYRLCQLKPTPVQIRMMLDHKDSPYIRAVGFLYLRYVGNPRELWGWFQPYVRDDEEFTPSPESMGKLITIGDFVRDIVLDQYYFETIFPRIPKPVQDDIIADLKNMGFPTTAKGNAGQGGADRRGVDDGGKRPASVKASLSVALGQRAPNRAGAREEGRGLGAGLRGVAGPRRRSPSNDRIREQQPGPRRRSRSPYRRDAGRDDRDHRIDHFRHDRERDYRREVGRDDRRRDERRDYGRRDYNRRHDDRPRSNHAHHSRDGYREDYRSRPRDGQEGGRYKERDDGGRDARDVFRERAAGSSAPGTESLKSVYG